MNRRIIALVASVLLVTLSGAGNCQELKTVTGVITAFHTVPLNKVRVTAEESRQSVLTDSSGVFSLQCAPNDLLVVSASGFRGRRIKVGNQDMYKIDLSYTPNENNFREATGNGHISPELLRQSVLAKSSRNEKDYSRYQTIYELISNEIYNVRVKGNSVVNTKVRSFDTSPQVLYVVNGVIVADISYIIPDYVKSIEFIDDVGATLYGSKGANGVLKITLK